MDILNNFLSFLAESFGISPFLYNACVGEGDVTTSYTYDSVGQLIRVNDPFDHTSGEDGTTWVYEYDRGGNILSKKRYAYTMDTIDASTPMQQYYAYSYEDSNWKDKLTAYNGIALTYDAIGNLTSDSTWSYEWEKGRQLKQMSSSDVTAIFEYNHDGLRVRKTVNGVVTDYTLHGKNVVHMTQGVNSLHFWYDAAGKPALVEWNNGTTSEKYAYLHNLQGDIVGIIDSTGVEVVKYTYDAWGKILSTTGTLANTLGKLNPFRYRGYVYDEETGLYYLRSRYYNFNWGRFINADCVFNGNLFEYCINSPILYYDPFGYFYESLATAPLAGLRDLTEKTKKRYYNCYGFAIGKEYADSPGGEQRREKYVIGLGWRVDSVYYDVDDMARAVIRDLGGTKNAQIVDGITAVVPEGWYMIALRTTQEESCNNKSVFIMGNDYHFMRRFGNEWKHKVGSGNIKSLDPGQTPETPGVWNLTFNYDSKTVYMIIREDWE